VIEWATVKAVTIPAPRKSVVFPKCGREDQNQQEQHVVEPDQQVQNPLVQERAKQGQGCAVSVDGKCDSPLIRSRHPEHCCRSGIDTEQAAVQGVLFKKKIVLKRGGRPLVWADYLVEGSRVGPVTVAGESPLLAFQATDTAVIR
jgi:hypothetical protein